MYERAKEASLAMECYRKGRAYRRAVELARTSFPTQVNGECMGYRTGYTVFSLYFVHINFG